MIDREQAKRCVGAGWHSLIDEFYDESPEAIIIQVKEKYGRLCIYHDGCTDKSSDLEIDIANRSMNMCEECGTPCSRSEVRNWVYTLCNKHIKERQ